MPCSYYTPAEEAAIRAEEMNTLTRAACEAMRAIERHGLDGEVSSESQAWWEKHKEMDRKRKKAEQERAASDKEKSTALKKLTAKERKALGFK